MATVLRRAGANCRGKYPYGFCRVRPGDASRRKRGSAELAERVAKLPLCPHERQARVVAMHNRLEKTRPVIFCDPEMAGTRSSQCALRCKSKVARRWKRTCSKISSGGEMGDDHPVEPFSTCRTLFADDWGGRSIPQARTAWIVRMGQPDPRLRERSAAHSSLTFEIDWNVSNGASNWPKNLRRHSHGSQKGTCGGRWASPIRILLRGMQTCLPISRLRRRDQAIILDHP